MYKEIHIQYKLHVASFIFWERQLVAEMLKSTHLGCK